MFNDTSALSCCIRGLESIQKHLILMFAPFDVKVISISVLSLRFSFDVGSRSKCWKSEKILSFEDELKAKKYCPLQLVMFLRFFNIDILFSHRASVKCFGQKKLLERHQALTSKFLTKKHNRHLAVNSSFENYNEKNWVSIYALQNIQSWYLIFSYYQNIDTVIIMEWQNNYIKMSQSLKSLSRYYNMSMFW